MVECSIPRRTPLYDVHIKAGARFTNFGGWEMPVQYSGIIDEHKTVRSHVGLFDVSHMGEILLHGHDAAAFLQHMVTCDVCKMRIGQACYALLLNSNAGVVDDLILYRLADDEYLLCVNASNTDKDFEWICNNRKDEAVEIINKSPDFAQVAVQGPKAREVVADALGLYHGDTCSKVIPFMTFQVLNWKGVDLILAASGYTGEDGFEIFCPPMAVSRLWERLIEFGESYHIKPIGLGARDTLRFEACYPLYGHELRDDVDPITSGLSWAISWGKGNFIGREVIESLRIEGTKEVLVCLEVIDRGIVRKGAKIYCGSRQIGSITSGTMSPTFNKALAMAIIDREFSKNGTELFAEVRDKMLKVQVVKKPFYKRSN